MVTLDEVIQRMRKRPEAGQHEIVRGLDGLGHLIIVVSASDVLRGGCTVREYRIMCWCGADLEQPNRLEVVPDITCIECIKWGRK